MSQRAGAPWGVGERAGRAFHTGAALSLLLLLAVVLHGCDGDGAGDETPDASPEATGTATVPTPTQGGITPIFPAETIGPATSPTPTPPRTVAGEPAATIVEEDVSITLEQIDDPWDPEEATGPGEGKRFVSFLLTVRNNGEFPLALFAQHFILEDSDGVSYEATPSAGPDPRLFYEALEEGDEVTASVAFELDEGATIAVLKYRPRVPGAGEIGFEFS